MTSAAGARDRLRKAACATRSCDNMTGPAQLTTIAYVDVAGLTLVKERMLAHDREAADLGLSFVISAGWMPGISELVPVYANALARSKMDTIESLTAYFGDSGEWSDSALRDAVWFIHQTGLRSPGYFRRGERTRTKMSAASCKADLGDRM